MGPGLEPPLTFALAYCFWVLQGFGLISGYLGLFGGFRVSKEK